MQFGIILYNAFTQFKNNFMYFKDNLVQYKIIFI